MFAHASPCDGPRECCTTQLVHGTPQQPEVSYLTLADRVYIVCSISAVGSWALVVSVIRAFAEVQ